MFRVINNTCQLCSFVKFYLYRCRFVTVTLDKQTSYQPFSSTLISVVSKVLIYETVLYLCLCKIWIKINVKNNANRIILSLETSKPMKKQMIFASGHKWSIHAMAGSKTTCNHEVDILWKT